MHSRPALDPHQCIAHLESTAWSITDPLVAKRLLINHGLSRVQSFGHLLDYPVDICNVAKMIDFDQRLSAQLFSGLMTIELWLRQAIGDRLSLEYSPMWWRPGSQGAEDLPCLDPAGALLQGPSSDASLRASMERFVRRDSTSHDSVVGAHHARHPGAAIESWIMAQTADFSLWSQLWPRLRPEDRVAIAAGIGLRSEQQSLKTWFKQLHRLRNHVAHHQRLWGKNFQEIALTHSPSFAQRLDQEVLSRAHFQNGRPNQRGRQAQRLMDASVGGRIVVTARLCQAIQGHRRWADQTAALITSAQLSDAELSRLGLRSEWATSAAWTNFP